MHFSLRSLLVPAVGFVSLLVVMAYMAGMLNDRVSPDEATAPEEVNPSHQFVVEIVSLEESETVPASIVARDNTTVSSRLVAQVNSITVRAGDRVRRGELLVSLDDQDLRAQNSQARAQASSLEALLKDSQQSLSRITELNKQGLASASELDRAKASHSNLTAQLQAAKQKISETETQLGYAQIKAPFDGVVIDRTAEPGDTVLPGKSLITLFDPTSLVVEVNVRESLAVKLNLGDSLDVTVSALNKSLTAEIIEIVPAANAYSRAFTIKASIPISQELKPGMFARVKVMTGQRAAIMVPETFVSEYGQLSMVNVLNDGKLQKRFVRLGQVDNGLVEVVSGLDAKEVVAKSDTLAVRSNP